MARRALNTIQLPTANFDQVYENDPCIVCGRDTEPGEPTAWVFMDTEAEELITVDEPGAGTVTVAVCCNCNQVEGIDVFL